MHELVPAGDLVYRLVGRAEALLAHSPDAYLSGHFDAWYGVRPVRLLVVGGDAAGMSAAAQARRRRDRDELEIVAF